MKLRCEIIARRINVGSEGMPKRMRLGRRLELRISHSPRGMRMDDKCSLIEIQGSTRALLSSELGYVAVKLLQANESAFDSSPTPDRGTRQSVVVDMDQEDQRWVTGMAQVNGRDKTWGPAGPIIGRPQARQGPEKETRLSRLPVQRVWTPGR